jgi:hypothetical protein
MSQGFMTDAELATYSVPEHPASPEPTGGYVVACVAFYKQGFSVPPHQFLRSLLQYYGSELHHLTPLGILHITALVTLCKAYIGIKPHFDMWNHFFHVRPLQGSGIEVVDFGGVDIYVKSRHGVDPYFHFPMSKYMDGL